MDNHVTIVYFSGTGGTKRIADAFEKELLKRGSQVSRNSLDFSKSLHHYDKPLEGADLVILILAVHAFDAPKPVYNWISSSDGSGKKAAVISVSGGGEIWPNTGCRNNCCKALESRGFEKLSS